MIGEEVLISFRDFWDYINTFEFPIITNGEKEIKAIVKEKTLCFLTDLKRFQYIDNKEDLKEAIKNLSGIETDKKDIKNFFDNIPIGVLVKMETKPLRYLRFLFNNGSEAHDTHIAQNTTQITLLSFV
jgi:hypothetical protein